MCSSSIPLSASLSLCLSIFFSFPSLHLSNWQIDQAGDNLIWNVSKLSNEKSENISLTATEKDRKSVGVCLGGTLGVCVLCLGECVCVCVCVGICVFCMCGWMLCGCAKVVCRWTDREHSVSLYWWPLVWLVWILMLCLFWIIYRFTSLVESKQVKQVTSTVILSPDKDSTIVIYDSRAWLTRKLLTLRL